MKRVVWFLALIMFFCTNAYALECSMVFALGSYLDIYTYPNYDDTYNVVFGEYYLLGDPYHSKVTVPVAGTALPIYLFSGRCDVVGSPEAWVSFGPGSGGNIDR